MPQGTIRKLYRDEGYGYVEGERGYWFFNRSTLNGTRIETLKVGQAVEFKEGFGPSGPRADDVKTI
jgi:cold shock CspA family protein